jgi:hypothetical protein
MSTRTQYVLVLSRRQSEQKKLLLCLLFLTLMGRYMPSLKSYQRYILRLATNLKVYHADHQQGMPKSHESFQLPAQVSGRNIGNQHR